MYFLILINTSSHVSQHKLIFEFSNSPRQRNARIIRIVVKTVIRLALSNRDSLIFPPSEAMK